MSLLLFTLCGFIFYIVGKILIKWPPKKINYLYGYRTPRSMKSQMAWDVAQNISARIMRNQGLLFVVLGGISKMFPKPEFLKIPHLELILPLVIVILGVVFMIYKTEQHLAQIISKEKNN